MKKNIAMRVAAFLFILTMITTCAFATTFAKYTTKGEAEDSARVAKWGVTVSMVGMDQTEYEISGEGIGSQDAQISSATDEKNIAPGSQLRFATIGLSGTPEVAVQVTFTANLSLTGWEVPKNENENEEYCPLVFSVKDKEFKIGGKALDGSAISTVAELEAAVEAAIVAYSAIYNPNTNLVNQNANTLTVYCQWAYAGNDVNDTALGDAAADGVSTNDPAINLSITCTVTQID